MAQMSNTHATYPPKHCHNFTRIGSALQIVMKLLNLLIGGEKK